jgi:hypothetical protein
VGDFASHLIKRDRFSVTESVVPIGFIFDALDCVRARNLPVEPILRSANIPVPLRSLPNAHISVQQFALLWRAVSSAIEDEAFDVGARAMRPGSFDMLCTCVIHSQSLGRAIRRALQFLNLILDDPKATSRN